MTKKRPPNHRLAAFLRVLASLLAIRRPSIFPLPSPPSPSPLPQSTPTPSSISTPPATVPNPLRPSVTFFLFSYGCLPAQWRPPRWITKPPTAIATRVCSPRYAFLAMRQLIRLFLTPFDLILDEAPRYERDNRSASPRPARDNEDGGRRRSASPNGNTDK